jgi:hypothetical protein
MKKKSSSKKGVPPTGESDKKSQNLTKRTSTETVALNFAVPAEFRKRFKIFAAEHDMKQVDILYAAFEEYEQKNS